MSYLNTLRLHFAGQFQANISTVNNDPYHFYNAAFLPNYQSMQGPQMVPPNGWFSPQGDAAFRLLGCQVTSAWLPTGQVTASDPVLGFVVADSDSQAPAKLADLDSEQQMVSEIWGLQVRIADLQGNTLLRGDFEPMAFTDIWARASKTTGGGDNVAGAMWQSVLQNLRWGNVSASPFLSALQQASAASGMLSIKFNLDGINLDYTSPQFMCGRIVGTIGPAASGEPHHLVVGRQFMSGQTTNDSFYQPPGSINFCVGCVDETVPCIFLDLGNALPTVTPGSGLAPLGDLNLTVAGSSAVLGTIPATGAGGYTAQGWYEATAGVVALPLTSANLSLIAASPLTIASDREIAGQSVGISEWSNGAFVRADTFVFRMSPGETASINLYAMQWGQPLSNASITFALDPSQLQPTVDGGFPYAGDGPAVATPVDILTVAGMPISETQPVITTGSTGLGLLSVGAGDPGNVRWFNNGQDYGIDGQVYGLRPAFAEQAMNVGPQNELNFISFLVWSGFQAAQPVTWADLSPIFQQYANLYPVMNRFLNLADYGSVVANAGLLQLAFGLTPHNPNSMPATRDLSPAKRTAILAWLADPTHPKGEIVATGPGPATRPPQASPRTAAAPGGKAAALARRLAVQSR